MSALHFGGFRFHCVRGELSLHGQAVELRPKTAAILVLLLARRGEIVSKADLAAGAWGTQHVQDQSIFQAMSELRRALAPLDPIATHPNLGYSWTAQVQEAGQWRPRLAAAAAMVLTVGMLLLLRPVASPTSPGDASLAALSPSLQAFATGLNHLRARRSEEAERFFALAVRENPRFDEARLLRSEALLAQGRVAEASSQAHGLLLGDPGADPYIGMAAMEILSRAEASAGHPEQAVHWAQAALAQASEQAFVCAAADIQDRLATLLERSGNAIRSVEDKPRQSSLYPAPIVLARVEVPRMPEHCRQMLPDAGNVPDTGALYDATSGPQGLDSGCARPCDVPREPRWLAA